MSTAPVVRIERVVAAAIDDVFAAWTDAALMAEWLSPEASASVEADPRPGGRLRVVMAGRGIEIEHEGEYLVVERPTRLVFTWSSRYTAGRRTRVTVELSPDRAGTRVVLLHEGLPEGADASHRGGWLAILDRLADVLRALPAVSRDVP